MPKSRASAWAVTRPALTIFSMVSSEEILASGSWMVTSATRRSLAVSIMIGPRAPSCGVLKVSSPMNSVWPGNLKPAL